MPDLTALRPLTADLPPIVILSSLDSGGAGIAALRLHQGLVAAGANVKMVVIRKQSGDDTVGELKFNGIPLWDHAIAGWTKALQSYPARPVGLEMFSTVAAPFDVASLDIVKNAGLVNLHWCAGMLPWPEAGAGLRGKPLVWTLHDMNPFTGGCHYTGDCDKWRQGGCENCPQLGPSQSGGDLAAANFAAKRDGYAGLDLHIVTPSRWLGDCAGQSALFGKFPREVIPYGYPLQELRPADRAAARQALKLPRDRKIILFGADVCGNRRKGLHLLLEALPRLAEKWLGALPILATFGNSSELASQARGFECYPLGQLKGNATLSCAYNAADVFVLPSLEDNLPNTIIEAQACGTPGVGFAIGGLPDIVADASLGRLATPFDVNDLAEKIREVLTASPDEAAAFRKNCREHAEGAYGQYAQALAYLRLYRQLLGLPEVCPDVTPAVANPAIPAGDYAAPELRYVDADFFFPCKIVGDTCASNWPWFRKEIPHNWYVDCRAPAVGFLSRDEAILLYNAALPFAGEDALEIGCFMGWSACHLALAGVKLDVIDPLLARDTWMDSVSASLAAAGVRDRVNLMVGTSPGLVEELCATGKRWKFIFIDGDHEAPGPRLDAEVCEKYAPTDALVMFHDVAAPAVADGVRYFCDKGWNVRLYHTVQIMAAAWRGDVPVPRHTPDPRVAWTIPDHLADLAPLFEPTVSATAAPAAAVVTPANSDDDDFAPIVLFVYNRLELTQKTIAALQANPEATQTDLYVFADGAKPGQEENVNAVREYLRAIGGFRSVRVVCRESNMGLAPNIIDGVTAVVNARGRVIVMEDDLVTSPYFLRYMNEALTMYADITKVACISGYAYPMKETMPDSYFIRHINSWGWGTWQRAWELFNPNRQALYDAIVTRDAANDFDFDGCYPYTHMLQTKKNSWAIRWLASVYLHDMLCLYPGRSLINHIGFGADATNCKVNCEGDPYRTELSNEPIPLRKINPVEIPNNRRIIGEFMRWGYDSLIYAANYAHLPGPEALQLLLAMVQNSAFPQQRANAMAELILDKLIAREEDLENAHAMRGFYRWQLGNHAAGEADIREELRRHPSNSLAHNLLRQIESRV